MKIAYMISMLRGGVPAFTYREIEVLDANGFEIALCPLTYRAGPYMPKPDWPVYRMTTRGILLAHLGALVSRPARYLRLLRVAFSTGAYREFAAGVFFATRLASWGAQHVHCHFGDSKLYAGYFAAEWLCLPLTVTLHAYEIHRNPNPAMFKLAAARCRRVVVQSDYNKALVERNFGIEAAKILLARAHGDMTKTISENSIKVLMVAEFREKKGHEVLFEAVKKLGRKDITLWIVGEGGLDVPGLAESAGVSDQTLFLGSLGRDLLNIVYDACDFLVQPSRTARDGDSEGIPAVLMEAMSHAKPVISTRHAGIPELVPEILVEENSVDQLAQAIAKLADDSELRREQGRRNREIIRRDFSDAAVLQLGDMFRESDGGSGRTAHSDEVENR